MIRKNRWSGFAASVFAAKATATSATLLISVLLLAGSLTALQLPPDPTPGGNDGILGPQLIAWSEIQKPQPVAPRQSQPDARQSEPDAQQQTARTVTGVVAKVENNYVLQTGDSLTYKLDDRDKARPFEGKRVRVEGTLDPTTGILHVTSIELLS
jgi:hypothetical protein